MKRWIINSTNTTAVATSSEAGVPVVAYPAEYSKPSLVPEQLQHNQSNQLKIKQGLLVLQRALAKDYGGAINNLADSLANQVKANILTLLKNGVINPLLSPLVSKAAGGGPLTLKEWFSSKPEAKSASAKSADLTADF